MCRTEWKAASMTHSNNTKQSETKQTNKEMEIFHFFPFHTEMARVFDTNMHILHTSQNQSDFRVYLCHHSFVLFTEEKCQFFHLPPLVGGNFKMKTVPALL